MKPYRLTIYPDSGRKYRWRLTRRMGGKIVADSAESYTRRRDCRRAVWNLPLNFAHVEVVAR